MTTQQQQSQTEQLQRLVRIVNQLGERVAWMEGYLFGLPGTDSRNYPIERIRRETLDSIAGLRREMLSTTTDLRKEMRERR